MHLENLARLPCPSSRHLKTNLVREESLEVSLDKLSQLSGSSRRNEVADHDMRLVLLAIASAYRHVHEVVYCALAERSGEVSYCM